MNFIDEVKSVSNKNGKAYLKRWIERVNVKQRILEAAESGFTNITWDLTRSYEDAPADIKRKEVLSSDYAIAMLKEHIGRGFFISKQKRYKKFLGLETKIVEEEFLIISWKGNIK